MAFLFAKKADATLQETSLEEQGEEVLLWRQYYWNDKRGKVYIMVVYLGRSWPKRKGFNERHKRFSKNNLQIGCANQLWQLDLCGLDSLFLEKIYRCV